MHLPPRSRYKWFGPTLLTFQTRSAYYHSTRLRGLLIWKEAQKKNGRMESHVLVKAGTAGKEVVVNKSTITYSVRHDDEPHFIYLQSKNKLKHKYSRCNYWLEYTEIFISCKLYLVFALFWCFIIVADFCRHCIMCSSEN